MTSIVQLKDINLSHVEIAGGKNASTGEMIQNLVRLGLNVPGGFATTAEAYRQFLLHNKLDKKIPQLLKNLNINHIKSLDHASKQIRQWIIDGYFLPEFEHEIAIALKNLGNMSVAVRSSATAEDLPSASFAGQQETFLNVSGLKNVLRSIKYVFASLFTSRAIAYRQHHQFVDEKCAISVGIQPMIRSDKGASGVIFTLDTESGFEKVILITATYGLGEAIVQGQVNPDEYFVYKPILQKGKRAILQKKLGEKSIKMIYAKSKDPRKLIKTIAVPKAQQLLFCIDDNEIKQLAEYALLIENHYGQAMDIEWAKDGIDGKLYIVQARPETVKSREKNQIIERFSLKQKGKILAEGQSVGQKIGQGKARVIHNPKKMQAIKPGDVLVTDMTDPDWEPIMKIASAIVTNRGGRTCHAAIIARELGIPAVVGCGDATLRIKTK